MIFSSTKSGSPVSFHAEVTGVTNGEIVAPAQSAPSSEPPSEMAMMNRLSMASVVAGTESSGRMGTLEPPAPAPSTMRRRKNPRDCGVATVAEPSV